MPPADCGPAASAVVTVLASQTLRSTKVELTIGSLCPVPELLFEHTFCPITTPPGGGEWIGNALVTFGDAREHGYLNITKDGQTVGAFLIAIATPPPQAS
jgi:hypothetical protein